MTEEQIIDLVPMTELLEKYGIQRNERGMLSCVFHEDNNPSVSVHKDRWYHCFSCGKNYNVVQFVMAYEKCGKAAAISRICKMFRLNEEQLTPADLAEIEKIRERREREMKKKKNTRAALLKLIEQIQFWQTVEKITHPTKGEIRRDKWIGDKLFFVALKMQRALDAAYRWLNDDYDRDEEMESYFGCKSAAKLASIVLLDENIVGFQIFAKMRKRPGVRECPRSDVLRRYESNTKREGRNGQ